MITPAGFTKREVFVPIMYQVVMIELGPDAAQSISTTELNCTDIHTAIADLEKFQDKWGFREDLAWDIDEKGQRAVWHHEEAMVVIHKDWCS
jgi:hypothetical protein